MSVLAQLACGVTLVWLVVKLLQVLQSCRTRAKDVSWIPGPPALPLLGNLQLVGLSKQEIFHWKRKNYHKYGSIYKILVFNEPKVFVRGAEMMKSLLLEQSVVKGDFYHEGVLSIFTGLVNSDGEEWHRIHKMVIPSFHVERLETVPREIVLQLKDLLLQLDQHADTGVPFLPNQTLQEFTLTTSLNVLFGFDYESIQRLKCRCYTFMEAVEISSQTAFRRLVNPLLRVDWIFKLTSTCREFRMANNTIKEISKELINHRRECGLDEKQHPNTAMKNRVFYDNLVNNIKNGLLTEDELSSYTTEMILSAETTATTLQYLMFSLGCHPEVQEKLREEIDKYSEKILSGEVSFKELNSLEYLDRVLKESMRVIPTVDLIARKTVTPLKTSAGVIPAGTEVILDIFNTHYDPEVWPHPERFDPERFSAQASSSRDPFSYLPFGGGPRKCIGYRMALAISKTFLVAILSEYKIISSDKMSDHRFYSSQVLRCASGPCIKLFKRAKSS